MINISHPVPAVFVSELSFVLIGYVVCRTRMVSFPVREGVRGWGVGDLCFRVFIFCFGCYFFHVLCVNAYM